MFFYLRLNKRLNKQSWGWWLETLSHPLWRQCDDTRAKSGVDFKMPSYDYRKYQWEDKIVVNWIMLTWYGIIDMAMWWRHDTANVHILGPLWGESIRHLWIPLTKGQWCGTLVFTLLLPWIKYCWAKGRVSTIIFRLLFCCMPKWLND